MQIFITRRYTRYYHVATSGHRATIPVPAHTPGHLPPRPVRVSLPGRGRRKGTREAGPGFRCGEGRGVLRLGDVHWPMGRPHGVGGEDLTDDEPVEAHPERRPVLLDGRRRARESASTQEAISLASTLFKTSSHRSIHPANRLTP